MEILSAIHGKDWRQFLKGKGFILRNCLHFPDQNSSIFWYREPCNFSNFDHRLPNDLRIQASIGQNHLANLIPFLGIQEICTTLDKFCSHSLINCINYHHRLLRSTNRAIIKGFTQNDRTYRHQNMGSFINNCRGIPRTDTDGRMP